MSTFLQPRPGIFTVPFLDTATCAQLIQRAEAENAWHTAGVMDTQGGTQVLSDVRHATISYYRQDSDAWRTVHDQIEGTVRPLIKAQWGRDFPDHSPVQLVRYNPGGFYKAHQDCGEHNNHRYFTVVCYLNDDFEGGGTSFPNEDYTVAPACGMAVVFPANYLHRAEEIIHGTKYVAVTWIVAEPSKAWI